MVTSDTILKVAKVARLNAYLQFVIAILFGAYMLGYAADAERVVPDYRSPTIFIICQIVAAIALLVVAKKLEDGKTWAGNAMFLIAAILFTNLFFGLVMRHSKLQSSPGELARSVIGILVASIPTIVLLAVVLNARSDIRDVARKNHRDAEQRGKGAPVVAPDPSAKSLGQTKPPPPAKSLGR